MSFSYNIFLRKREGFQLCNADNSILCSWKKKPRRSEKIELNSTNGCEFAFQLLKHCLRLHAAISEHLTRSPAEDSEAVALDGRCKGPQKDDHKYLFRIQKYHPFCGSKRNKTCCEKAQTNGSLKHKPNQVSLTHNRPSKLILYSPRQVLSTNPSLHRRLRSQYHFWPLQPSHMMTMRACHYHKPNPRPCKFHTHSSTCLLCKIYQLCFRSDSTRPPALYHQ